MLSTTIYPTCLKTKMFPIIVTLSHDLYCQSQSPGLDHHLGLFSFLDTKIVVLMDVYKTNNIYINLPMAQEMSTTARSFEPAFCVKMNI